jgi:hypothetical protein
METDKRLSKLGEVEDPSRRGGNERGHLEIP